MLSPHSNFEDLCDLHVNTNDCISPKNQNNNEQNFYDNSFSDDSGSQQNTGTNNNPEEMNKFPGKQVTDAKKRNTTESLSNNEKEQIDLPFNGKPYITSGRNIAKIALVDPKIKEYIKNDEIKNYKVRLLYLLYPKQQKKCNKCKSVMMFVIIKEEIVMMIEIKVISGRFENPKKECAEILSEKGFYVSPNGPIFEKIEGYCFLPYWINLSELEEKLSESGIEYYHPDFPGELVITQFLSTYYIHPSGEINVISNGNSLIPEFLDDFYTFIPNFEACCSSVKGGNK